MASIFNSKTSLTMNIPDARTIVSTMREKYRRQTVCLFIDV